MLEGKGRSVRRWIFILRDRPLIGHCPIIESPPLIGWLIIFSLIYFYEMAVKNFGLNASFPFGGARRLGCQVVQHPRDSIQLGYIAYNLI